jgi:ribosomal protein S13
MSDVKAELMEIRGIGEAKADAILSVLEDQDVSSDSKYKDACQDALEKLEEGHASHAEGHLKSVL